MRKPRGGVISDGIWFESEYIRRFAEGLVEPHGLTVVEALKMAREKLVDEVEPFEFKDTPDGLTSPPPPWAKVDMAHAMYEMEEDTRVCVRLIVENPRPSIQEVLAVIANQLAWARFWAIRAPTAGERAWYAALIQDYEAMLRPLALRRGWRVREVSARLEEMLQ